MEFRHLRFFVAVADELHFTRAAERLRVAQPYLSHEIRRLERELGVVLFERDKRRVALTPAGAVLRDRAVEILAATDEAVELTRRAARGEFGMLAIGYVSSASYELFPAIVQAFRAASPDVLLVLRELTTVEQLRALRENRLDVGFVRPPVGLAEPELEVENLLEEECVVALPSRHRLARRRNLALGDLAAEPWIVFDRTNGPGLYVQFERACEAAGFSPNVRQEAGQVATMINLVATGLGVALVPSSVSGLTRPDVRYRRLTPGGPTVRLAMASRAAPAPAPLRQFLELARSTARRARVR